MRSIGTQSHNSYVPLSALPFGPGLSFRVSGVQQSLHKGILPPTLSGHRYHHLAIVCSLESNTSVSLHSKSVEGCATGFKTLEPK